MQLSLHIMASLPVNLTEHIMTNIMASVPANLITIRSAGKRAGQSFRDLP